MSHSTPADGWGGKECVCACVHVCVRVHFCRSSVITEAVEWEWSRGEAPHPGITLFSQDATASPQSAPSQWMNKRKIMSSHVSVLASAVGIYNARVRVYMCVCVCALGLWWGRASGNTVCRNIMTMESNGNWGIISSIPVEKFLLAPVCFPGLLEKERVNCVGALRGSDAEGLIPFLKTLFVRLDFLKMYFLYVYVLGLPTYVRYLVFSDIKCMYYTCVYLCCNQLFFACPNLFFIQYFLLSLKVLI